MYGEQGAPSRKDYDRLPLPNGASNTNLIGMAGVKDVRPLGALTVQIREALDAGGRAHDQANRIQNALNRMGLPYPSDSPPKAVDNEKDSPGTLGELANLRRCVVSLAERLEQAANRLESGV